MCGIVGILRADGAHVSREVLERMTASVAHRGPDDQGLMIRDQVGLGHRRLAIIDPNTGKQPMANEDQSIWITYNGEIYNFVELRSQLEKRGHVFATRSDTEVVVHAYEEWGSECVNRLRGMFAFGLVDFRMHRLLLARDCFGMKPLHYRIGDRYFAFASELSALRLVDDTPLVGDLQAVDLYLRFQYIPTPHTIYRDVFKLPPAHYLVLDLADQTYNLTRYWDLCFEPNSGRSDREWLELADSTIRDSVKAHLVSDVPFGVFLSGGVDSTLVAMYMSRLLREPVKAFAIGFDEAEYSELRYAAEAAKRFGLDLHTAIVREDMLAILPDLITHYGEPFGDSSAIPTWYLSRLARGRVPMVLSGDGGDEAFAGYQSYARWMERRQRHRRPGTSDLFQPPLWRIPFRWARLLASGVHERLCDRRRGQLSHWQDHIIYVGENARKALWRPEHHTLVSRPCELFEEAAARARAWDELAYVQYLDIQTYLPCDILTKVDVASMYHGLEVRPPLVDRDVVQLAASLPLAQRYREEGRTESPGKYILKQLLSSYFPREFAYRSKQGFAIPRAKWFLPAQPGRIYLEEVLLDPSSQMYDWFEPEQVKMHLAAHSPKNDNSGALWLLLVLGLWLRQNPEVRFE